MAKKLNPLLNVLAASLCVLVVSAISADAQEASPFDDPPAADAPPADRPPPVKPAPAGAPATRPAPRGSGPAGPNGLQANKSADAAPETVQPALETNPAVRAALELPRKEPRDYVQATLLLIDLGRPELARPILTDLARLNLTDEQRIAIVNEFGSQGMLHLARSKELQPEAAVFADAAMAAANAAANNPRRIAGLIQKLAEPSAEARTIARNDLAATGQIGANAALEAVSRETDPQRRAALLSAIELMHPLVDGPLIAMLETTDARLRADVASILTDLRVPQAMPLLPTDAAHAERALATALSNYQRGTPPFAADASNQVEIWNWNDATKKLASIRVPADQAQTLWIARLAGELARVRPSNYADQRRALVLRLEASGIARAAANPIDSSRLAQADPRQLSDALAQALEHRYSHAALMLVEALARHSTADILNSNAGKPSPLAAALDSPDRRVRFAALNAIMTINPSRPYAGSSRVPEALAWFAGATGDAQAVVAMPTIAAAGDLAGKLAPLNLVAEATNRGRDAVDLSIQMSDLQLVLIDMNILEPDIRQCVYELRISPTTGSVPIAILAPDGRLAAAERVASEHTRVIAVPRPHSPEHLAGIVAQLNAFVAQDAVPANERLAQAEQAKKWLAVLGSGNRPFYTFRRTALHSVAPARQVPPPTPAQSAPVDPPRALAAPPASDPIPSQ